MQATYEEADFGEFFDFDNAVSDNSHQQDDIVNARLDCISHTAESNPCHDFPRDTDNLGFGLDEAPEPSAEDYSNFSKWIPRFVLPDEPCSYCRERQLQCFLSYGKVTCTACDTLFRPCSFAKAHGHDKSTEIMDNTTNRGLVDTLHTVAEDCTKDEGELTGVRPLRSKLDASKKATTRFSRSAVKLLKDWLNEHSDNPYPTEDEKTHLGRLTGLRPVQINNWLANARRRGKVGKNKAGLEESTSIQPTSAIGIPAAANIDVTNWRNLNPLERWKHSPPQNEPAPMTAIADALGRGDLPPHEDDPRSPSTLGYTGVGSSHNSLYNGRESGQNSLYSNSTSHSGASSAAWSGSHDSLGSFSSFGSSLNGKRERRRRRKMPNTILKKQSDNTKKRTFQCTFCTDTFTSKYDWTRHEKTLHLSLEKFICCPLGPETLDPSTGQTICAYCCDPEPTKDHLETHNHLSCVEKGIDARTFYRKDHLRQHLRLVHDSKLLPQMESWRIAMTYINSRCGFCSKRFAVWSERNDHLAAHFKDGAKMKDWKGCRGLDPAVAALVNTAMPPYLIGQEAVTPSPFSATNPKRCMTSQANFDNGEGSSTCWEILTVRLGRYAKEQTDKGVLLTDAMLQSQARRILYDSDDSWDQTAADNPEWLDLFKRAHALDYIPREISGIGENVPQDLEVYGDLGMRVPFSVQLQQTRLEDLPADSAQLLNKLQENFSNLPVQSQHEGQEEEEERNKDYPRFSALPIPQDRAVAFETISGPWPRSGVRGQTIYTNSSSTRSSLSQPSQQAQGPYTPCDVTTQLQSQAGQFEIGDYLNQDINSLFDETTADEFLPAAQPKPSDFARQQNAMLASQHGLSNLTPLEAQHQLAELNAAMAGIASTAPNTTEFLNSTSTSQNQDFTAMAPQQSELSDLGFGYEFETVDNNAMMTAAWPVTIASNTDVAMQDIDLLEDLDFDIGFS